MTMANNYPAVFNGAPVDADLWFNRIAEDLTALSAVQAEVDAITGPWTSYSPVWRSSGTQPALGDGTLVGAYSQSGQYGQVSIVLTIGAASTFGTGIYRFDLPTGWTFTSDRLRGLSMITDATGNVYLGGCFLPTAALVSCRVHGLAIANSIPGSTIPMTWAAGDKWYLTFSGEVEP